ncbi:hypothetical protein EPO44_06580 [bacterium]|nr:MAG: hypothetical protein EPO44_06580 [bacterium]
MASRLVCGVCGHEKPVTSAWLEDLRAIAEREGAPPESDVFNYFLARLTCSQCRAKNVQLHWESPATDELDDSEPARTCSVCSKPIPLTRLQALPSATRCVRCQENSEQGLETTEEPVYCKQCGARMVWRVRTSVLPTKYFLGCSNFPRCRFVIADTW